jgi:hypothetical protein
LKTSYTFLSNQFLPDQEPESYLKKHRKLLGFINVRPGPIEWKCLSCDIFALARDIWRCQFCSGKGGVRDHVALLDSGEKQGSLNTTHGHKGEQGCGSERLFSEQFSGHLPRFAYNTAPKND